MATLRHWRTRITWRRVPLALELLLRSPLVNPDISKAPHPVKFSTTVNTDNRLTPQWHRTVDTDMVDQCLVVRDPWAWWTAVRYPE